MLSLTNDPLSAEEARQLRQRIADLESELAALNEQRCRRRASRAGKRIFVVNAFKRGSPAVFKSFRYDTGVGNMKAARKRAERALEKMGQFPAVMSIVVREEQLNEQSSESN